MRPSVRFGLMLGVFLCQTALAGPKATGKTALMAVNQPKSASRVRTLLVKAGYQVRDVMQEYDYFHGISALKTGNIDNPRPGFWPTELSDDWQKGISACKTRAGKPPYGLRNKVAFLCGSELSQALWQRWLDFEQPDVVIVVEAGVSPKKIGWVKAQAYGHRESVSRNLEAPNVPPRQLAKRTAALVRSLLKGKGSPMPRPMSRALPQPGFTGGMTEELKQGKALELDAVALPEGCQRLLPALKITPESAPLAKTITSQWNKTVAGKQHQGQVLNCQLALIVGVPIMPGLAMRHIEAQLRCGEAQVSANRPGISAAHGHAHLSPKLIGGLLKSLCK